MGVSESNINRGTIRGERKSYLIFGDIERWDSWGTQAIYGICTKKSHYKDIKD